MRTLRLAALADLTLARPAAAETADAATLQSLSGTFLSPALEP